MNLIITSSFYSYPGYTAQPAAQAGQPAVAAQGAVTQQPAAYAGYQQQPQGKLLDGLLLRKCIVISMGIISYLF